MKKIEKIFRIFLVIAMLFTSIPVAFAASSTISLKANSTNVSVGDNVEITVHISGISGATNGISAFGADVDFSSEYLDYTGYENLASFPLSYSTAGKNIGGFALSQDTFATSSSFDLIKLKFKAKKEGKTTFKLNNTEVSDGVSKIVTSNDPSIEITIGAAKSTNANLIDLAVSGYTISPAFNKNTTSYTVTVPNSVTSVEITATPEDPKAGVSGTGTKNNLNVGNNSFTIKVTAESGATKNYTVVVKREDAPAVPKDSDNTLKSLEVEGYTIEPSFSKDNTDYSINVPSDVNSVNVKAVANSDKATVSITGNTNLQPGENTIKVTVKAEDGSTKVYNVKVYKDTGVASDDATLKSLGVSGYDMSPAFSNNNTEYNVTVPNEADSVIINAVPNNPKARVEITGNTDLKEGNNKVTVKVIAEDGTEKVFTINVTKKAKEDVVKDSDSSLKSLSVSGQTLNPAFSKENTVYSMEVGSNVSKLDVSAIPNSDKATVSVTGNTNLKNGMNTVTVTVTAEDGSKTNYIINVYKKASESSSNTSKKSSNSYLDGLTVSGAELSPSFNKDNTNYSVTVPYDTEKLDINYFTSDPKATVEIIGNDELQVGKVNSIQVKVTAEDGSVRIYTINATRSAQESNNKLKILTVGGYSISPSFNKDIYNYSVTVKHNVDKLDLTALAENPNATVEIVGNKDLKVGTNTILIKVTDENGFMRLYQLEVTKQPFTILGMSVGQFILFSLLGLALLGILFFLILLLKRKKDKEEEKPVQEASKLNTPIIDFKPEFNFGSRNGTDDDIVYPNGVLNQGSTISTNKIEEPKKLTESVDEAYYEELADTIYDDHGLFDETITKDELIAAIREGMQTKNTDKLKMLLKQDELNQLKKKVKSDEEKKKRSNR